MSRKPNEWCVGDVGEFELIDLLLDTLGPQPQEVGLGTRVVLGAGDDCAAVSPGREILILHTTDTMVEGIHYLPEMPPEALGWKSLASNISDIAAMGGLPTTGLITLGLPPSLSVEWLLGWYRGMAACAASYQTALSGGDIVRTRAETFITVGMSGEVEAARLVTRGGAQPGDCLVVTGSLGDSAAGLALYRAGKPVPTLLLNAHLRPEPRVPEARAAVEASRITAMLDLSDGLAGDLRHLCRASGVGARVEEGCLPFSQELLEAGRELGQDPLHWALSGGEDYELLMCVPAGAVETVLKATAAPGRTRGTVVGEILPSEEGLFLTSRQDQRRPLPTSFQHFEGRNG